MDKNSILNNFHMLLHKDDESSVRYPFLFSVVPIFSARLNRAEMDTSWDGITYNTDWGSLKRIGPGLDVYDEDTLIGLLRTAGQKLISGKEEDLPIGLNSSSEKSKYQDLQEPSSQEKSNNRSSGRAFEDESVNVIYGETSAYLINKFLQRGLGGTNLAKCRDSIKRLSITSLTVVYNNPTSAINVEGKFTLFNYIATDDFKGTIQVQFPPMIVKLLDSYTAINMDIRRELTDVGKSLHKFLSSQDSNTSAEVKQIKEILGYKGSMKNFLAGLRKALEKMKELQWLDTYEITGTGRAVPYILHTSRL